MRIPDGVAKRYQMLGSKVKLHVLSRTFERFSRTSLTIYVLQFSWMIVFRFVHLGTGDQWMYTIGDTVEILAIILVTLILFGIVAYVWDKHGYKYTLDRLERRVMQWHPFKKK